MDTNLSKKLIENSDWQDKTGESFDNDINRIEKLCDALLERIDKYSDDVSEWEDNSPYEKLDD